jgi:hypothetical protein
MVTTREETMFYNTSNRPRTLYFRYLLTTFLLKSC